MKVKPTEKTVKPVQQQSNDEVSQQVLRAAKMTWLQFSTRTSIHGVQYISDPRGNLMAKILWISLTVICFITANALVHTFWVRYKSNPTRMIVDTNYARISEESFPAITFCPSNTISFQKADELVNSLIISRKYKKSDILKAMKNIIGFLNMVQYNMSEILLLQQALYDNRYTVQTALQKLVQPCEDFLVRCRWEGVLQDCRKLFVRSETYLGYCCTFNSEKYFGKFTPAKRTPYYSMKRGLSVVLEPLVDNRTFLNVYSDSVKMLVHDPNVYPSDANPEKLIPQKRETAVKIKMQVTFCSETVKSLPISDRGCVFPEERKLQFFRGYKEANCVIECRMLKTVELCACLPYFYPQDNDLVKCNFENIECLVNNYDNLRSTSNSNMKNNTIICDCPIACNSRFYDVQVNSVPLINFKYNYDPFYQNLTDDHMVVHTFLGNQVYTRLRKDLESNWIGLVSSLGGVYSLFIGMSVLSFLEIIYFASIRFYQNYKYVAKQDNQKISLFTKRLQNVDKIREFYDNANEADGKLKKTVLLGQNK